jgi:Leucine-rich repeat (LRR) protein
MKRKLLFTICILTFYFGQGQYVTIDSAFEDELITQGIDSEGVSDGRILLSDALSTISLNLSGSIPLVNNPPGVGLLNVNGIEFFANLETLRIEGNSITNLDLSLNTNLRVLRAWRNGLQTLNVEGLVNLETVGLNFNNLSNVDFSSNIAAQELDITDNNLTFISMGNKANLGKFTLSNNPNLAALNISGVDGSLVTFDTRGNTNLLCIEVSSIANANNQAGWLKEAGTSYTENCSGQSYTLIPDTTFENYLIAQGIDSQGIANGRVLTSDIQNIVSLDMQNLGITNLSGIDDFISLQTLNVNNNGLVTVDLSANIALTSLSIQSNLLSSVNITQNINLITLNIAENSNLSTIDVSQNTQLEIFTAYLCNLQSLDLSTNSNLEELTIYRNSITALDVTSNPNLKYINAEFMTLSSLDISQNPFLENLFLTSTVLNSLDVSNNPLLIALLLGSNNLTSLDISNLPDLNTLYVDNNNLTELSVRQNQLLNIFDAQNNNDLTCIEVIDVNTAENQFNWRKDATTLYSENCNPLPFEVYTNIINAGIAPNYEITEGNTFTLNFEADNTTTNGTQFTPNIDFTINGSSAVTDFRFNGNETTIPNSPFTVSAVNPDGSITISAFDDGIEEGNEVYTITITSQDTSSYTINGPTSFDVTVKDKIIDNLFDVNITLGGDIINMGTEANPDYQINEGGTILINIEAYNGGIEGQEYNLSYRDNLAEIPNDFERKFDIDPELLLLFFTPNINTNPDTTYSIEATRDNTIDDQVDYINLSFQNDQQSLPEYRINNLDINSVLNFTIKIIDIDDTNSAFIFANFDNSGGTEGGTDTFTVNLTAGGNPWQNNTGADIILPITFTNARLDGSTIDLAEIGDYTPSNGNIVIAPNTSQGSMTIDLVRDSDKDHEFYLATIEQPTAIPITLTNSTMEAKIIDEEAPFDIFVLVKQVSSIGDYKGDAILEGTLCCPEYAVEEGQKIEIAFEAEKGVQPQPFTIKYDFGGVAIENTDFTNLDERAPAPNNQFGYNVKLDKNPDNFLQMQVTKDADYYEQTEKLLINLTPIESSKFNLNKTSFTFNIYNVLPVSVEAIDNIANEEDALNDKGKFLLSLPVLTTRSIYVEYELSGSAIEGVDYVSIEKGVIFNEGEINKEITISAIQDDFPEELETIKLSIIDRPGYSIDNSKREATIDIPKNDQDKITFNVTLTALESQIFENPEDTPNEAAFEITITPPNTTGTDIEINYAFTNGNETYFAIENEDFIQNGNGTLIFGDGETTKQITVSAILDEDIIPEQTEIITLALTQGLKYDSNATTDAKMKIISKDFDNTRLDKESLKVVVTSNSCKDFSEGDLLIENSSQFEFDVFVKKSNSTENPKTGELLGIDKEFFNDLESGEYTITFQFIDSTITIIPPIFIVRIEELSGTNLLGQSFNLKTKTATLLVEGSKEYVVTNEAGLEYLFKFKDFNKHSIEIPVKSGLNNITIKGEANCQGELQSSFYFNDFVVYPNPTKGVLFINGFSLNELANVAITDYSGKQLMSFKKQIVFGNLELDLSNLAQGVYYGAIKTPKGQDLKLKIVKN